MQTFAVFAICKPPTKSRSQFNFNGNVLFLRQLLRGVDIYKSHIIDRINIEIGDGYNSCSYVDVDITSRQLLLLYLLYTGSIHNSFVVVVLWKLKKLAWKMGRI